MEEVAILKKNVGTNANYPALTTSDIDRLVQHLYRLKHFGKNLEALKKKNVKIYEAQNREVNHRVRSNTSWGWNSIQNIFGAVAQTTYSRAPNQLAVQQRFSIAKSLPLQQGPPAYQEYQNASMPLYTQQHQDDPMDPYTHAAQQYHGNSMDPYTHAAQQHHGNSMDPYSQQYQTGPTRTYPSYVDSYSGHSRQSSTSSKKVLGISIPTFKRWGRK
jgi:hypothetical protein